MDQAIRFSKIWWKSRADAEKSQEYMALGLGVSKKTIQNWEKGIASPNLYQGIEWFQLLGLNPIHYYLEFLYPWIFNGDGNDEEDKTLEEALISLIKNSSTLEKKQLLFLISGNHGSSWYALLQLFTAHCHTSMQSRAATARLILDNYEIENKNSKLVCPDDIKPDMSILNQAISKGKMAAMKNDKGYVTPSGEET
ncbi:MAG: helix-turn-helix transcriptional regulator [Acutalibacteraceae bacterium]